MLLTDIHQVFCATTLPLQIPADYVCPVSWLIVLSWRKMALTAKAGGSGPGVQIVALGCTLGWRSQIGYISARMMLQPEGGIPAEVNFPRVSNNKLCLVLYRLFYL